MTARADMLIRVLALTAGVAVSALALLAWRVPASQRTLGTDVTLEATQPGELRVRPQGPFASAHDLRPGGRPVRATLSVANAADLPLGVAVSARPGRGEASRALWVEVRVGSRVLARGPVSGLGRPSRRRFALARRGTARVQVTAWLPDSARGPLRARLATARIGFQGLATKGAR